MSRKKMRYATHHKQWLPRRPADGRPRRIKPNANNVSRGVVLESTKREAEKASTLYQTTGDCEAQSRKRAKNNISGPEKALKAGGMLRIRDQKICNDREQKMYRMRANRKKGKTRVSKKEQQN